MRHALPFLALALASTAQADTLALWDFNTDDGDVSTGTLTPAQGSGTLGTVGGATTFFTSGSPNDPAGFPLDSGWSVGGYPDQGTGSGTVGLGGTVSSAGYQDVTLSFDVKNQPSANKWFGLYVTLDGGLTYTEAAVFSIDQTDTWESKSFLLAGTADNAAFGFQILAVFAPGTTEYEATEAGYNGDFGAVYDVMRVSADPVPEPLTLATLGLGMLALRRRKR